MRRADARRRQLNRCVSPTMAVAGLLPATADACQHWVARCRTKTP